jgi:hypothetical protein
MVLWFNKVYKGPNESLVVQPVVNDSMYNLLEENKCSSGMPWKVNVGLLISLQNMVCLIRINAYSVIKRKQSSTSLQPVSLQDSFGIGCSFFIALNLQQLVPSITKHSFTTWWRRASKRVSKDQRKGVNTLIILGPWMPWKQRKACVWGRLSSVPTTPRNLKLEAHLWTLAGASKLQGLWLSQLEI